MHKVETICALATAIGQSGIGVVRVSGPLSKVIANKVLNVELEELAISSRQKQLKMEAEDMLSFEKFIEEYIADDA